MRKLKPFRSVIRKSVLCVMGTLVALGVFAPQAGVAQGPVLYTVAQNDANLRTVDPVTGDTLSSVAITISGDVVRKATGLAVNPQNGDFFALLSLESAGGDIALPAPRTLAILNPGTGVATFIGSTGDAFADIAFALDGTLYAVTGDGAAVPETLYTLSTTDGSAMFVDTLGNGDDGEAIAFNPNDGLIYHMSGIGTQNVDKILESFDPTSAPITPTPINYSLDDLVEVTGATHWVGDIFLITELGTGIWMLRTDGRLRFMNFTDHSPTGLAVVGSPPACPPLATIYGAAHQGPDGPSLLYQINPATGAQTLVGPIGFERVGAMDFLGTPINADPADILFAVGERMDGTDTPVLLTLDPCTGLGTEVGPTGVADVHQDLSFQVSDGTLFGDSEDFLDTLNTAAGTATGIGAGMTGLLLSSGGYGLASDPADNTLYLALTDIDTCLNQELYTVDTGTGAGTFATALTFPAPAQDCPRINGMDFKPDTGVLFASVNDGEAGIPENHLGTVNTATGEVTILGQTQGGLDAIVVLGPGYRVNGSPASQTTPKGTATTFTVNIDSVNSSWDTVVDLTCTVRSGVTCGFDQASVTPGAAGATATLTVTPSAGLTFIAPPAPLGGSPWKTPPLSFYVLALVGLALLMLTGVKVLKPTGWTRRLVQYSAMMLLFAGVLAGCGGDNPPPPVAFNITITGTSGSVVRTDMVAVTAN